MFEFIKLVENYRKCNDLEFDQIANMDETPLFLDMVRTRTIAKIGSKTVNIKTHDQEKNSSNCNIVNCSKWYKIATCLSIQRKPKWKSCKKA